MRKMQGKDFRVLKWEPKNISTGLGLSRHRRERTRILVGTQVRTGGMCQEEESFFPRKSLRISVTC
jgi:hypothetical protein